ncbi:MAG: ATP-binding protein, partial [Desulfuromonadaceae bacterium]
LLLRSHFAPETPDLVTTDPTRLQQLLSNLVSNAIKFTEKGSIDIHIGPEDSESSDSKCHPALHIAVSDTGIGIPEEHLEHMFASFSQLDGSVTRRYGGTGLGLAICRELVTLMNGRIWTESVVDAGSTFHCIIPVALEQGRAMEKPQKATSLPQPLNSPRNILLAEDNFVNQRLAAKILEQAGHRVRLANNGAEALLALEREDCDLVLLDVQMPELDGLETTRIIRDGSIEGIDPNIPIIALTAHAMQGDAQRFLDAGMNGYLAKPIDRQELLNTIANMTAGRHEQTQPSIDMDELLNRLDNNRQIIYETWKVFSENAPELLQKISTSFETNDRERAMQLVHSLKGAAANIGATRLQQVSARLEQTLRETGIEDGKSLWNDFIREFEQALAYLEKHLEE